MKNIIIFLAVCLFSACTHAISKVQKDVETALHVEYQANSSDIRIENIALDVEGICDAKWDGKTEILYVKHKPGIDIHQVHIAICNAGFDTDMYKADSSANKTQAK